MKTKNHRRVQAARRILVQRLDDPAPLTREVVRTLSAAGVEPLVLVPLAIARLFLPRWEKLSRSSLVADLVRVVEAWLTRPGEERRMAAATLARQRACWEDELRLVRPPARRSLHRWKHWGRRIPHPPRDQFPLEALLAEKFARLSAEAAGALTSKVAMAAAEETFQAMEGDSRSSPEFVGVRRPLVDAAMRNSLRAWASGKSRIGRPRRSWTLDDDQVAWLEHMRSFERYDPAVPQAEWLALDEHEDREAWIASGRSLPAFATWRRSRSDALFARIPDRLSYGRRMDMWWDLYQAERLAERATARRSRKSRA